MTEILTVEQILAKTGTTRKWIAQQCSVTTYALDKWIANKRIPEHQWQKLIDISHGRITWDMLEKLKQCNPDARIR